VPVPVLTLSDTLSKLVVIVVYEVQSQVLITMVGPKIVSIFDMVGIHNSHDETKTDSKPYLIVLPHNISQAKTRITKIYSW
jgi:hypothetical protein